MMSGVETLLQDLGHACRALWRAKGFTLAAAVTLALGIAGTTVMFALIQGVLLRPLPVRDQDRLIVAWREAPASGSAQYPFGNTDIGLLGNASQLLERVGGVTRNGVSRSVMTAGGTASYVNVGLVTGGFFDVLGVQARAGRALTVDDERKGAEHVIVISSGLWQRGFGSAPDVIGRRVTIGEQPFVIVGVMPPDLDYPTGAEVWQTTTSVPTNGPFGDAAQREVNLIARLRPGVTLEQASGEIVAINQQLPVEVPTDSLRRGFQPVVRPFVDVVIGDIRLLMLALLAAVGLVLLIASANVANLLLMRGEARRGELAVRVALGAGRTRIIRQVLGESVVLASVAGVIGFVAATWSLPVFLTLVPDGLPRVESVRVDEVVIAFAVVVTFVTALLAGLTPGWLTARVDLMTVLRGNSAGVTSGPPSPGRRVLVVAQVSLAVTVLAGAGLLVRSVLNLQSIDLGLPAERLVLIDLHLPASKYAERLQRAQFLDAAIAQLEGVPDIAATTPVNVSPFADRGWDVPRVTAEGQSADEAINNPSLNLESIHPNYFSTFEVPILQGRSFTRADREGGVRVAIVSADAASSLWPGKDPIGKRLKMGGPDSSAGWLEVVGVAAVTRYRTVTTPRPTLYLAAAQFQVTAPMLVVRSTASLDLLASVVNARIRAIDPAVQVMRVAPFADFLERPLARPTFAAFLLGLFAIFALLLASVGLYAVMSAYVRQREREIALRLALGATATRVRRLVLAEVLRLAGVGAVIGAGGAIAAAQSLRGMLFEISPLDPVSLAGAAILLVAATALAAYGPLRRAERADMVSALRSQ
jgi:putative ABC transport system permease protein